MNLETYAKKISPVFWQAVYREKNRERIREYDRKWRQNKKLSKV